MKLIYVIIFKNTCEVEKKKLNEKKITKFESVQRKQIQIICKRYTVKTFING